MKIIGLIGIGIVIGVIAIGALALWFMKTGAD